MALTFLLVMFHLILFKIKFNYCYKKVKETFTPQICSIKKRSCEGPQVNVLQNKIKLEYINKSRYTPCAPVKVWQKWGVKKISFMLKIDKVSS